MSKFAPWKDTSPPRSCKASEGTFSSKEFLSKGSQRNFLRAGFALLIVAWMLEPARGLPDFVRAQVKISES